MHSNDFSFPIFLIYLFRFFLPFKFELLLDSTWPASRRQVKRPQFYPLLFNHFPFIFALTVVCYSLLLILMLKTNRNWCEGGGGEAGREDVWSGGSRADLRVRRGHTPPGGLGAVSLVFFLR